MEWINVKDRLPESGKKVLICLTWPTGRRSRLVGQYLAQYSHESTGEYDDYDEYDEANDRYTYRAGWWECVENWDFSFVYINELVTHWMPLPEPPEDQ